MPCRAGTADAHSVRVLIPMQKTELLERTGGLKRMETFPVITLADKMPRLLDGLIIGGTYTLLCREK
jgi:hypothetical protein